MPRKPITFVSSSGQSNTDIISRIHAANKSDAGQRHLLTSGLIDSYQRASLYGNKRFDSSKWLLQNLDKIALPCPVRLLDVGALRPVYSHHSWIDAFYIDLHPKHPAVQRADFLEYDGSFGIVCLSLVINFVGCPKKRFQMICRARRVLTFEPGVLFIVLPKAVLMNSRRMTTVHFESILNFVGFTVLQCHHSSKLSFYLCQRAAFPGTAPPPTPNLRRRGANNFRIMPVFDE